MIPARPDYLRMTDRPPGDDVWTAYFAGDCVYEPEAGAVEAAGESRWDGAARNGREGGPIGPDVVERATAADLSVVNLAAPVPADVDPIDRTGPTKRTGPETPTLLREAGFNVATLANDHSMDYGERGLERTIAACHESSLLTCGAGEGLEGAMAPVYLTVEGTSVAVFDFCERGFGVALDGGAGTAWISHPGARRRVAEEADRSDVVVVVAHGGVEYVPLPSTRRQEQLRAFADVGADLVVGHRPHVPQGWEVYEGTPIFYSLGDFLQRSERPATRWGLSISVEFAGATPVAVELVPTVHAGGSVRELARGSDRSDRLHHLHRLSAVTADRQALRAHWQEVAVRVFEQRYVDWLTAGTGGGLLETVRRPIRSLSGGERWAGEDRRDELLRLLNLVRNESHRDVIETALEVRAGDVEDRRTPEVRSAVRELLSQTDDRPAPG